MALPFPAWGAPSIRNKLSPLRTIKNMFAINKRLNIDGICQLNTNRKPWTSDKMRDVICCVGRPLAAEINNPPLQRIANVLAIHKRLTIDGVNYVCWTRIGNHARPTKWWCHLLYRMPLAAEIKIPPLRPIEKNDWIQWIYSSCIYSKSWSL